MSNLARLLPAPIAPARADHNPALVYLASLAPGSRPTMRSSLERVALFLAAPSMDRCLWHELRFAHTQAIRAWALERYAPATANRILAALRGVLRVAYQLELLGDADYRRAIQLPTVRGSRTPKGRALTRGELDSLFQACRGPKSALGARDGLLLALCYGGGLRRAEAVGLGVDGVHGNAVRVIGKGSKERVLYLAAGGVRHLDRWLALRGDAPGPLLLACTKAGAIDEPRRGLCGESVAVIMERLAEIAGVAHFSPHDLRRTFVGDLLDAGADVASVAGLAGHARIDTTARYDRRGEAAKMRAADLLSIPFHE